MEVTRHISAGNSPALRRFDRRRRVLLASAGAIALQALWMGCALQGGEERIETVVRRSRPAPAEVVKADPIADATLSVPQWAPTPTSIEQCLLPPDNPWVRRVRLRGIQWPMVLNWGVCYLYDEQTGQASFYHEPQPVASGGHYDPNGLTAAHKTLPFGTIVRCTRTDTRQSVVVMINDRGPFIRGRIIDLSRSAAHQLDLLEDGVVPCRLEVLAYPLIETMGPKGNG